MGRSYLLAAGLLLCAGACRGEAISPGHREIRVELGAARTFPGGGHSDLMEAGPGVAGDLGVALTPDLVVGVQFGYSALAPTAAAGARAASPEVLMADDWKRYSGGLFVEYGPGGSRLAPFVGTQIGVQGVRISDAYPSGDVLWHGEYGLGFGACTGLRYRPGPRYGVFWRLQAERSPSLAEGWFYGLALGGSLYL